MAGFGWWGQNYGLSWVVTTKLWLVVGGCGLSHDLVLFISYHFKGLYETTCYKTKSNISQVFFSLTAL